MRRVSCLELEVFGAFAPVCKAERVQMYGLPVCVIFLRGPGFVGVSVSVSVYGFVGVSVYGFLFLALSRCLRQCANQTVSCKGSSASNAGTADSRKKGVSVWVHVESGKVACKR